MHKQLKYAVLVVNLTLIAVLLAPLAHASTRKNDSVNVSAPTKHYQTFTRHDYGDHTTVDAHSVETLVNKNGTPLANYAYDLAGNVIERGEENGANSAVFYYDGFDRQRRVDGANGKQEIYYYDENGQRYLSVELDSGGNVVRSRLWFRSSHLCSTQWSE